MLYKPPITRTDARQKLRDIRCQYQKYSAVVIEECEQLRIKHKQVFDNQWKFDRKEKTFEIRIKPIIQEKEEGDDDELPMIDEFINDRSESSSIILDNKRSNKRILTPKTKNYQRCLSVSSITSTDKRKNRVYQPWPDYPEISRIVGYRIEKPAPIVPPTPPPVQTESKKGKKPSRFANAAKKVQNLSTIEKEIIISKPIIDEPIVIEPIIPKETQPKLPALVCPSSELYSKRIRTRQWLIKNDFTSQSHPLI